MKRMYIPENLDLKQLLIDAGKEKRCKTFLQRYYYIISRICYSKVRNKSYGEQSYVRICNHEIRDIVSKRLAKEFFEDLIELGIIECDEKAIVGIKCKGYRLTKTYRNQNLKVMFVTDFLLDEKINKKFLKQEQEISKMEKHLQIMYGFLKRIKVDYKGAKKLISTNYSDHKHKFNQRVLALDMVHAEDFFFNRGKKGRRLNTNISTFPKELRQFIKVDDAWTEQPVKLVEIDIKNSQPLFLLVYLLRYQSDSIPTGELAKYQEIVEKGFYEYFMEKLFIEDRDKVKKDVYKKLLFNKRYGKILTEYEMVFKIDFPNIFNFISTLKESKGHQELSHRMQKVESAFIVDFIAKKYTEQYPQGFIATIHDSILVLNLHSKEYKALIEDTLKSKYGITASLHTKVINEGTVPAPQVDTADGGTLHNPKEIVFKHLPKFRMPGISYMYLYPDYK